ncbi:flagellar biosynthesis protein FlhB [Cohnella sp. CFH 77786]|uniref:flagellar biosynthesis protein FlhB n=1 Tax=Cohnella sp. CFH 77786 TaxID=2662265 RepID=UPI001C6099A1|nr:flagellar biosynthesis protein FlhB [Cohnella sp. CFH 77786]MBW5444559.1 flagellar biosynthesis protein FlhB [Cohnella sp. CFH 77786]
MPQFRYKLDLQLFAGEKTEKATPKKRQEARNKGQVAKSVEIPHSLILVGVLACFMMLGPFFRDRTLQLFGDIFLHRLNMDITDQNVLALFFHYALQTLILLSPILIIVVVIAFAATYVQIGWLFTTEPLKMSLSKLNPLTGAKNLFKMRSLIEFLKSALKLTVIGLVVYWVLWSKKKQFLGLAHVPVEGIFSFTADLILQLGLIVAVILFVLSIGDYLYSKFEYEKSLKMSKQDIKDEHKNAEGDPLIKGKIKEKQRRMALMRMMQEVPKADVVITNPTHFAVALQYDGTKMEAPVVVAKGQDYLALRIREIARKHDVVIMENKPLARALYERSEVGDSIPADLFQAVAEVLAYVYRLKGRRRA